MYCRRCETNTKKDRRPWPTSKRTTHGLNHFCEAMSSCQLPVLFHTTTHSPASRYRRHHTHTHTTKKTVAISPFPSAAQHSNKMWILHWVRQCVSKTQTRDVYLNIIQKQLRDLHRHFWVLRVRARVCANDLPSASSPQAHIRAAAAAAAAGAAAA